MLKVFELVRSFRGRLIGSLFCSIWGPDVPALAALAASGIVIFRVTLFQSATLIGNSDRLNNLLSMLVYHLRGLRTGAIPYWDSSMFGGFNTFGLDFNPLTFIYSMLPAAETIRLAALGSLILFVLIGWSCFLALRQFSLSPFAAFVAAALYQASSLSVLQVMQSDYSALVLIFIPLLLSQIRGIGPNRLWKPFVIVTVALWFMMSFLFLQAVAYSCILFGAYAAFLSTLYRDWRFVAVVGCAGVTAGVGAIPRLVTISQDMSMVSRDAPGVDLGNFLQVFNFQNIRFVELLRLLDDGIFGRFPSEVVALGNNINLTEGMQLYTSVIAIVIVAAGVFCVCRTRAGVEDRFMVGVVVLAISIIALWPFRFLTYLIFWRSDLTHARVTIIALFPMVFMVARVLEYWNISCEVGTGRWRFARFVALAVVMAGGVLLVNYTGGALSSALPTFRPTILSHLLDPPRILFTTAQAQAPRSFSALRSRSDTVRLYWQPDSGAQFTLIYFGHDPGAFMRLGLAPAGIGHYEVSSLDPTSSYEFRIASCNARGCSNWLQVTVPVTTREPVDGAPLKMRPDLSEADQPDKTVLRISTDRLIKVVMLTVIGVTLLVVSGGSQRRRRLAGTMLGMLAVMDALIEADFQINGPQTRWTEQAFQGGNMMTAAATEFRVPDSKEREAMAERLETNLYRAVAVCDPTLFNTTCAPFLAHFWDLRLLDGYTVGIPRGLAAIPWPPGVREMRSLSFRNPDSLDWRWLALFNVKYAICVNRAIFTNGDTDQLSQHPLTAPLLENPQPVVPRVFFAAAIESVPDPETAIQRLSGDAPVDPRDISFAVGAGVASHYDTGGTISAVFDRDHIDIRLDPASTSRFLVLNEQPHPGWRAEAGGVSLFLYSVNGAMRGVMVPPGVSHISLVFRPFAASPGAIPFLLGCLGTLVIGFWVFRRLELDAPYYRYA